MRKKPIIIFSILVIFAIISIVPVQSIHYVEQAESLEQHFPSLKKGNYYVYLKTIKTRGEEVQYTLKIEITGVIIEKDYFLVNYTLYINDSLDHEESLKCTYNELFVQLGELRIFNTSTAAYDKLSEEYDKSHLTYYWIGSTPIRALVLERNINGESEKILIDEGLGIILELDIYNSTTTIKYRLIETNEIYPHLGAITFFGIVVGIIIMSLVAYEIKIHTRT